MRLFFILLATVITVQAQTPQVPHKMEFAGMTLTIRDDARREIQKDVNALTQSPKHHNIKIERAKTYFPIIEKVFEEERVPEDFKYLVLQESALIADAVSVSNAVGFWQFKDYTAVEMGLRVDKEIDERLNIVSSSRAAARYIKKNNFYFNNWLHALQAYQMGAGGAMKSVPKNQSGARQMEITSSTYWYVKKFLAHKVAFENAVEGAGQIKAIPYQTSSKKLLADIAKEVSVNEDELKQYNKWAKTGHIPDDRTYTVIIPMMGDAPEINLPPTAVASTGVTPATNTPPVAASPSSSERIKVNGIKAIKAAPGENAVALAKRAGVKLGDFLVWNDITRNTPLQPDHYYLLGKKRSRSTEAYHKVMEGESLWQVSQKYGVQIKRLRKYNRMTASEDIKPGMTLWLSSKRPKDAEATAPNEVIEVDKVETFAWSADTNVEVASEATELLPQKSIQPNDPPETRVTPVAKENSSQNPVDSVEILQPVQTVNMLPDSAIEKTQTVVVVEEKKVEPKKKEHIVQPKETLYGIAHAHNVGVMDLVRWNNLNIQDGIKPGQVLKLSENETSDATLSSRPSLEHEVKTTDTLYSIARKYGVTIKELMEWNNKKDFSLAIGERLKIQGK